MCICEGDAFLLSSNDGITENHRNSRIIIIARRNQLNSDSLLQICKNTGCKYIRVKSPDPDLFFILHAIIY